MELNRTPRRDPVRDGTLFKQRSATQSPATPSPSPARSWSHPSPGVARRNDLLFEANRSKQSPENSSPFMNRPSKRSPAGNKPEQQPKLQVHSPSMDPQFRAVRASFENLVRSSPLPKVLQQQGWAARASPVGPGVGSALLAHQHQHQPQPQHQGATMTPKPVRPSLVKPIPRFVEEEKEEKSKELAKPVAKPKEEEEQIVILDNWWIRSKGSKHLWQTGDCTGFEICGTMHSSFTDSTWSLSEDILERLGSRLLRTTDRRTVKLIGKPNTEISWNWQKFETGVPENWMQALDVEESNAEEGKDPHGHNSKLEETIDANNGNNDIDVDVSAQIPASGQEEPQSSMKELATVAESPSKRINQRQKKPIQRLGSVPDDEACFCGSSRLMKSPQKKPSQNASRANNFPGVGEILGPRTEQHVGCHDADATVDGTSMATGPSSSTEKKSPRRGRPPKNSPRPRGRPPKESTLRGRPPGSSPRPRGRPKKTEARSYSPKLEAGESCKAGVKRNVDEAETKTEAMSSFRTSRRGRRIVPKLEFWKNENIQYDRGEAVGVELKPAIDNKQTSSKRGRRKMTMGRKKSGEASRLGKRRFARSVDTEEEMSISDGENEIREEQKRKRKVQQKQQQDSPIHSASNVAKLEGEEDHDLWTPQQIQSLTMAQLQVDPTCRNFWQEVAKYVPGKTPDECFAKHFQKHPTPTVHKKKSCTGMSTSIGKTDDDEILSMAPSAAVRKQMKHMRWKRLKRFNNKEDSVGETLPAPSEKSGKEVDLVDDENMNYRRSSRLRQDKDVESEPSVRKESNSGGALLEGKEDLDNVTEALMGRLDGSKPKTLAAAIVSALAEVQSDAEEEDEIDDFYFTDDL